MIQAASDLDIIVRELAELVIIKTNLLLVLVDTERKTGNEVEEEEDDAGHDEGVGEAGDAVGELVGELDVVVVDPATVNDGGTVQSGDVVTVMKVSGGFLEGDMGRRGKDIRSKDTSQQVTDNTANTVLSKHIERLIDAEHELELGSKVAADTADNTKDESRPRGHITRSRGDGDKTSNGTGAEADGAPLPLQPVIEQDPGQATDAGGNVGDDAGHDGTKVGGQGAAAVEAEPADPEEHSPQNDVGDVVGAVGQAIDLVVAVALAEHERVGEGGGAGADVHGGAARKVETAHLERPAVAVPGPVGDGVVDDGGPDEHEHQGGKHTAAISARANGESGTKGVKC